MGKKFDLAIIGAGISGLTLAYYLKKKGVNVCLIEKSTKAGGVIQTKKINGFICEEGPNTIVLNNNAIINLINDLKIDQKIVISNSQIKNKFFLHKNKIIRFPNSIMNFITTPLFNFYSKCKILYGLIIFKNRKHKTIYNFFNSNFGKQFHDNLIEPFLNGIYAGDTKKMILEYSLPSLFRIIKKNKSLLYYLLKSKKKTKRETISFKDGNKTLIEKLKKENYNNSYYSHEIKNITQNNNKYKIYTKNKECFICNKIVSTISIDKLMELINHEAKYIKKPNLYNPIDVFHFSYDSIESHKIPKGFGLLSKRTEKKTFLGILFSSSIFPHVSPKNKELITILSGGEKQNYLINKDIDILGQIIKKEIKELFKLDKLKLINKKRWVNAIPKYNHEIKNIRKEVTHIEKKYNNLHIIGNFYNGVSVSSCIELAKKMSEKIN